MEILKKYKAKEVLIEKGGKKVRENSNKNRKCSLNWKKNE